MAKTIWTNDLKKIFVFAFILRLIIAPIFYHPDIKSQNFDFQFLAQRKINIYQYLENNRKSLPNTDTFNYLPLVYFSFGAQQIVLKNILPSNFSIWLNDWGLDQNNYPNLFYYLLILKLPYIFFDLGVGYLLYKIYNKKILSLWLFNPLSLYLIYVLANFDVVPVFFTVLAFYFLKKSPASLAYIFLGIATALKLYPLLFLPFFLFDQKTNIKKLFINILAYLLPLVLTIMPFIFDSSFIKEFSGSGLTQKLFESRLLNIPIYPVIYFIVFLYYIYSKNKKVETAFLTLFLTFIALVNFHPQWLLWFLPFVLYPISKNKKWLILFIATIALALAYVLLINDHFLFWGHFIPIDPFFVQLNPPYFIISQRLHLAPETIQLYLKYILAFVSLLFLIPSHENLS